MFKVLFNVKTALFTFPKTSQLVFQTMWMMVLERKINIHKKDQFYLDLSVIVKYALKPPSDF